MALINTDVPREQPTSLLTDFTGNGVENMYDYDGVACIQSNGVSHGFGDIDSAALLESLAGYDDTRESRDSHLPTANDHFASLVEAAATAGGQDAAHPGCCPSIRTPSPVPEAHPTYPPARTPGHISQPLDLQHFFAPVSPTKSTCRRIQEPEKEDEQSYGLIQGNRSRRQKSVLEEDAETERRVNEIWGPGFEEQDENVQCTARQYSPVAPAEARAAGVHSAAALFRRPSVASRKYTRAPMSKLFTSLDLDPEEFLRLQAAAKNFMLDPDHPERTDSVGGKNRAENEMTKLRLYGCVQSFLEEEGWGERCFGVNSPGAERRKMKWPVMKNKIISLVTPLLRRMVTNERQRLYAIEARQEKRQESIGRSRATASMTPTRTSKDLPPARNRRSIISPCTAQLGPQIALDSPTPRVHPSSPSTPAITPIVPLPNDLQFHIHFLQNNRRFQPRCTVLASECHVYAEFLQHIDRLLDSNSGDIEMTLPRPSRRIVAIKVLSPSGLVPVDSNSWDVAVAQVAELDWMDSIITFLVHVERG